jgi:hypothetical protein
MKRQATDQLSISGIQDSEIQLSLGLIIPRGNPNFKSKWLSKTTAIRIPVVYVDRVKTLCKEWESGKSPHNDPIAPIASSAPISIDNRRSAIVYLRPNEIEADPVRFQYKIIHSKDGSSGSLSGVQQWDYNAEGVLQVWQDPQNGKTYVINGHNRLSLAKRLGVIDLPCQYLSASSDTEARALGAFSNIKSGHGSALDCAKFLRSTGSQDLASFGIPENCGIAKDGYALSVLSCTLFNQVLTGSLDQSLAVLVGSRLTDHDLQHKAVEVIESGNYSRSMQVDIIEEIKNNAIEITEFNLFGDDVSSDSLFLEIVDLKNFIRKELQQQKRLFSTVVNNEEKLRTGQNLINVDTSSAISLDAKITLNRFEIEQKFSSPVSSVIRENATKLRTAKNKFTVRKACLDTVIQLLAG